VPDVPPARAVYTGGTYPYVLVLSEAGDLYGWGYEPSHAFGTYIPDQPERLPRPVRLLGLDRVVDVSLCTDPDGPSIFALRDDGRVWMAPGQEDNRSMRPKPLAGLPNIKAMGSFDDAYVTRQTECKVHAIGDDGSVWLLRGQRSSVNRLTSYDATATRLAGLPAIKQVSCNHGHCLALALDGRVWAWGDNPHGELGDGTQVDRSSPVLVRNVGGVAKVAAAHASSYALTTSGSVIHWGSWPWEQPAPNSNAAPVRLLNDSFDIVDIYSVRLGGLLVIRRNGEVLAWGNNFGGKLSPGPTDVRTPSRIPGLRLQ
jgi:alpha-tubulin suppressor-like RCC1 family protein